MANALRLYAVDARAAALGLVIGQPLANARAMIRALKVVTSNPRADQDFLSRIADWCDRFTPHVSLDGAYGLLLDVTGAAHLFGGEAELLHNIRASLRLQNLSVHGAIAGTAMAARCLAHYRDGIIIPPGEESQAIAPLPINALGLDPVTTHAFRRAGLKTIGQAASRKRSELTARFTAAMLTALDQAMGRDSRPISPRKPRPDYQREETFAEPVMTTDVIHAALARLASAIARDLEQNGQGARRLEASIFRTDGVMRCIAIETGAPTRDPVTIMRLFQEKLDVLADPLDPGFGFDLVRLCASRVETVRVDVTELDATAGDQNAIGFLVDRLAARFGSHRILSFQPNDTHIPEAAWTAVPAQYALPVKRPWQRLRNPHDAPRRPLRLFTRPEPALLTSTHINWRRAPRLLGKAEGPERIAMEWWRHSQPQATRDYIRIEDDQGRRYWLYRHVGEEQWFMHGLFA